MTLDKELITLLKEEIEILKGLEEITYKKTDIIVHNQVADLEEMIKLEEDLINSLGNKEKEREGLLDSWGLESKMTVSQLVEKLPSGQEELDRLREELLLILSNIQERNKVNNELIMDNLHWLDFNMNLVYNVQTPSTYGKENKPQGGNSLFDRKV